MDAPDQLAVAVAALREIESSRADRVIMDQNPNVALYELVGRMRTIAFDALKNIDENK